MSTKTPRLIAEQSGQLMDVFFFSAFAPKILSRCDLCLIQEVRDSKGEVIQALVKDLNRYKACGESSVPFNNTDQL